METNRNDERPIASRETTARELLKNPEVAILLAGSIDSYIEKLRSDAQSEEPLYTAPVDTSTEIEMLKQLKIAISNIDSLPKQADKGGKDVSGGQVGKVVFGNRVPRDGKPTNQLVIEAMYPEDDDEEAKLVASYRGRPADFIAKETFCSLTVTLQRVQLTEEGKLEFPRTHGVRVKFITDTGKIKSIRGVSIVGRTPHSTDKNLKIEKTSLSTGEWRKIQEKIRGIAQ